MSDDPKSQNRIAVLDLRGAHRPEPQKGALAKVCGLEVLVRNLLVLERQGYDRHVLLILPEDRLMVEEALSRHPRLKIAPALVEDSSESLTPAVERADPQTPALLYWPGALTFGRLAPALVHRSLPAGGAISGGHGPLILFSLEALRRHPGLTAAETLARIEEEGLSEHLDLDLEPLMVRDEADRRQAEEALLFSLRKAVDGAVAKYDRHISLAISRRLMKLPIHPNAVTVGAGLVGICCGLLAAQGGYLYMLLGALLFQLNGIMDGIDGEIARAKLLESRTGQWLDTFADDSSNIFFTVGAAVGCYNTYGSEVYLVLGAITGFGFIISSALMYHYLLTVAHTGDLNDFKMPWEEGDAQQSTREAGQPGLISRVLARLKFLVRRDTFTFLTTLFALVGQLRIMIWFYAAGASIVWLSIFFYRVVLPMFQRSGSSA